MYTTTITKSGQITLTKAAREKLGVKTGDKVYVDFETNELKIKRKLTNEEFLAKLDHIGKNTIPKELFNKYAGKSIRELQDLPEYQESFRRKYAI